MIFACPRVPVSFSLHQSSFPCEPVNSILIIEPFFVVVCFSLMVVFKLRFVFQSECCNDGVLNVWVCVSKAVGGAGD